VISPDVGGSDHFAQAVATANSNAATSNTIILQPGQYIPQHQPITITKNLTISGDHSFQTPPGTGTGIEINGGTAQTNNANQNFLQINSGVNVRMDGFNIDAVGFSTFAGIQVNGNLTTWGITSDGDPGYAFVVSGTGTATLNYTQVFSDLQSSIRNGNVLTMNNSDVVSGAQNGIENGGTLNLTNTVIAGNGARGCVGAVAANGGPGSMEDNTNDCGVQFGSNTDIDGFIPFGDDGNGGPQTTLDFTAAAPTHGAGVNCPIDDGRFFANPPNGTGGRTCDIGELTDGATQETTGPTCAITSTAADHSQQTVTLADNQTGIGPQSAPVTDNPTNTPATAYPPPAAVPVPGYAVDNLQISNGSIAAFNPFAAPSTNGVTLTASKTTTGTPTRWSFTGINWAGVSHNCF
jgi:hypothetical protein